MEKLCIIVLSCSKFSDLWSNNLFLFNKFWPDHPPLYIVSDGIGEYDLITAPNIKIYEGEMSDRIIKAIKDLDTDYVFLTFDDYFLKNYVDSISIKNLLDDMVDNCADYCGLFKRPQIKGKKNGRVGYKRIPLNNVYQINFYPCIWKRQSLIKVLKEGEDIWKTEVRLTRRARENNMVCFTIGKNSIFSFVDIVRKGKYLISGKHFIKKHKLFLSNRKTRSFKETFYLFVQTTGSRMLPRFLKEKIKMRLRKKGHIIYSDYENTDD